MTRPARPTLAHRLLCLLMAWVMTVAPMIVLAGEIHELEHLRPGEARDAGHGAAADAADAADATDATDGERLHDLADAAQCCNHIAAVLPGGSALLLATPARVLVDGTTPVHDHHLAFLPFRPPIRT